mmetsp:Transcript_8931/g.15128  ORF Transcript_8931/g.15128 Transcript_8931/m.15128 type:complete len:174 (+) Transcript_8931:347-868(+)
MGPDSSILQKFNKNPYKIADNFQIYRLVTPIVIHTGFNHLISNLATQLIFGSWLEGMVGFNHTMATYIVSGIGGNIFSAYCSDANSVGASTSINGLLTGVFAMITINWSAFSGNQQLEQMRCILLFFIVFAIVINLMIQDEGTDSWGHLGGAITGLLWGMAFFPRVKTLSGTR